jgi:hypothetical protein
LTLSDAIRAPGVAEVADGPVEIFRPAGQDIDRDGWVHIQSEKLVPVAPDHVLEHAIPAHGQLTGANGRHEHHVDEVPAGRLDRLAHQHETAHVDDETGLLEHLARRGLDQGLPWLHASPGQQPMPVTALEVRGQEDAVALAHADRRPHPHPAAGVAHAV